MGVEVVLIPNIHLETPNYNIVRIKHDDVNQETSRASYKMVELPAETSYLPNPAEEAKAVKAVAAVKGITPAAPAPIVAEKAEAKVSIIAKIKAFFANLGNKTKTENQVKNLQIHVVKVAATAIEIVTATALNVTIDRNSKTVAIVMQM